jgi:hypothetical protein
MRYAFLLAAVVAGFAMFGGAARAAPVPPGSYLQTCRDITATYDVLAATCRMRSGNWNYTTLSDYRDCDGDIVNTNGRLSCVRGPYEDDDWLPRGSYQETCRRERVEGDTLTAECVDRNGRWRYTELQSFRSCRSDIRNVNGMLQCRRGSDDGDDDDDADDGSYDLPDGNWRASCRRPRVYGSVLYAECRDRNGAWRETSIDLEQCDDDVENRGGRLVCAFGGTARVTLYRHPNYTGTSRTYVGEVADLNPFAFGNQASSVVVQGGVWQLCDRPNYRGFCVVIDRSVANLWTLGFNDRAESVRRIR